MSVSSRTLIALPEKFLLYGESSLSVTLNFTNGTGKFTVLLSIEQNGDRFHSKPVNLLIHLTYVSIYIYYKNEDIKWKFPSLYNISNYENEFSSAIH